ncbi:hypothetical protein HOLleu_43378 [Holothuria leucospilota]|uniref:Uncharacterized protein n=1 Tax=Holothuria leucospilota TaxID=206669 RepID=A0A9Q0YAS1_HOLLE|nr:hypothetical protein HOLleu_43378 [Holothuria leucospilota]
MMERETFAILKDHKDNFPNKVSCRFINPARSEMEPLSKVILDRINKSLRVIIKLNPWENMVL